jgi:hypothetical protein
MRYRKDPTMTESPNAADLPEQDFDPATDPGPLPELPPEAYPEDALALEGFVCRALFPTSLSAGDACPACGHTSLAHAGPSNPSLSECVLCRVQVSVANLATQAHALEVRLGLVVGGLSQVDDRLESLDSVVVLARDLEDRVERLEAPSGFEGE